MIGKKYEFRTSGCSHSGHPGVAIPDIRVWRAVTSGCRKAEDGHVTKLFCLLFVLFLLVLVKKYLYVEGTISTQIYIGTVPCVFVNNTGYPFQRQVVIQV
ncbi:hypothetical protein DW828_18960 [Parabacteroides merdae]|uniref:Uncharacterized protein n=1 Tax=Parabacteroides merdae TaxID=46503 RepID=A0A3R6EW77_9BACT|nr:hypothetical protein DW828_18960 [Parabacteroides merdae]